MTAKELIKQLNKFDENSEVIVSGCYGSTSGNLDDVIEENAKSKAYLGYSKKTKVICIPTDICSG